VKTAEYRPNPPQILRAALPPPVPLRPPPINGPNLPAGIIHPNVVPRPVLLEGIMTTPVNEEEPDYEEPDEYEKRTHENNAVQMSGAERSHQACERVFSAEIGNALNKFNGLGNFVETIAPVEKRQFVLGSLAFLAGLYTSNIVDTVKEKLVGRSSLEQRINFVSASINKMNAKSDLAALARKAMAHGLRDLKQQVHNIQYALLELPQLEIVESYVISKIMEKKELLDRLYYSCKERRADMVTSGQLVNDTAINQLEFGDSQAKSASNPAPGVLQIVLEGPVRSKDTHVYDVHAITHYVNVTLNATKMEYVGRNLLIKNETSNCVKGIDHQVELIVEGDCRETGYRVPQLKLRKKTYVADIRKEKKHSAAVNLYPYVIVYRWGNAFILKEGSRNITKICSLSPYKLHGSQTFHTSDMLVSHRGSGVKKIESRKTELIFDVEDTHFDNAEGLEDGSRELENSFQMIDYLNNVSMATREQMILANISGAPLTYPLATVILRVLAAGLAALVLFLAGCRCKARFRERENRRKLGQVRRELAL